MVSRQVIILSIAIFVNISFTRTHASIHSCNQTCGKNHSVYPLGFSPGCPIHINCSPRGEMLIHDYPIQSIDPQYGTIKINVQPTCDRPRQALDNLFTRNYAPASSNAILLQNCSSVVSTCDIPSMNVTTNFQSLGCEKDSNVSCFIKINTTDVFFDHTLQNLTHCKNLLSSVLVRDSGVSLEVQAMQLIWWVEGSCNCSNDAVCTQVPHGRGYRCNCREGFVGDGYQHGAGCRKAPSDCNAKNFWSGQCGGATRFAGLLAGVLAGAVLMFGLAVFCFLLRRRHNSKTRSFHNRRLAQTTGINIPIYPYKEIEKATNNFSEKQRLGTGAYGTVYAGKLNSDAWVAIKRIKHGDDDSIGQVINEIKLISSVNHPNLVRLLGCSIENGEQILVYEFMPNGTLCQHLQREKGDGLAWPVRLSIATETAQAIAYLHSAMDPPIYHRDIKSSNILLDYNFRSKVADFGLSRLGKPEISHISTVPQGTPGYVDPQYHQNFHLSDKSDVYSFGVVLVEIITALKAVDFSRPQDEVNLAAFATDRIAKGRLQEIVDPILEIQNDSWTFSSVHKVAELAFRCLAFHRDMRPSMTEVAAVLEQITLSRWEPSGEISCSLSSEISPSSSSSNLSEKPLNSSGKKAMLENKGLFPLHTQSGSAKSMQRSKDDSPISVQDPWLSEQSSTSQTSAK
ncbi:hypothetical protein Tsubulata_023574 [Turnera subulata]|uniref:Protein kinase domain-containing protein n=1 Tax=Turnera subulata TaxID=218843 RepID=A0A9Q0JFU1_9ROSI|nr:hypothetical protein Tsubulata_023574 [Turnera subulata]